MSHAKILSKPLIGRKDISEYGGDQESNGSFPILISRLVSAICSRATTADFPSDSAVNVGGWDGIVTADTATKYFPAGVSLWELGTNEKPQFKAESDYLKRTANPLGYNPAQCCFIFVTPMFWAKKDSWIKNKMAEGIWKEIRVFDSSNLQQWLELAPAVSRWFAEKRSKYAHDGVLTIEEAWKEWSYKDDSLILTTSVVTSGRACQSEKLKDLLKGPAALTAIKSSSRGESIAFIIAAFLEANERDKIDFLSKCIIVRNSDQFRSIRINDTDLILIADFLDIEAISPALAAGHHVLVPTGAEDDLQVNNLIELSQIDRDGQVKGLEETGLSEREAIKLSMESARNPIILKRLLKFPHKNPIIRDEDRYKAIIPAILLGKWNENHPGDIELIERLSGLNYDDYIFRLNQWRNHENNLILQIGPIWRLASPMDAWANLATIKTSDLNLFKKCFEEVFKSGRKYLPVDESSPFAAFLSPTPVHSSLLLQGILQSCILLGLYGDSLKISRINSAQGWVDELISDLLNAASGDMWCSLNYVMPLIAEASPKSFLSAVGKSLDAPEQEIMTMFIEREAFLHKQGNFTGLLWALEGLAWLPEFFYESVTVLARISALKPKVSITNSPSNSLKEIFRPWHFQTLATHEARMKALTAITKAHPEVGWDLLISMMPSHHGYATDTYRIRWRKFDVSLSNTYTYNEVDRAHRDVVLLLFSAFDFTDAKLGELLKRSETDYANRKLILDFAAENYQKLNPHKYESWSVLRELISRQRSHRRTDWSINEKCLEDYDKLYAQFAPKDEVNKNVWLFNEEGSTVAEGNTKKLKGVERKSWEINEVKIVQNRKKALLSLIKELGIDGVLQLSESVKHSHHLGATLGEIDITKDVVQKVAASISVSAKFSAFAFGYFGNATKINGSEWLFQSFSDLEKSNLALEQLAYIFSPLVPNMRLWDFLDAYSKHLSEAYWKTIDPWLYNCDHEEKVFAMQKLMAAKRFGKCIHWAEQIKENIDSALIIRLLEQTAREFNPDDRLDSYEVIELFDELDKREDVEINVLANLEWLFLPLLARGGSSRKPQTLQTELRKSPEFFIDMLKCTFRPADEELANKEREGMGNDEQLRMRAMHSSELLESLQTLPGESSESELDGEFLSNWVNRVRTLAAESDRAKVADMIIGKWLAQYKEKEVPWPHIAISDVIEAVNTDTMKQSFATAVRNKRGFSSRSPFAGGTIETKHANYFEELSAAWKLTHSNISQVFSELAESFRRDAHKMDLEAEITRLDY